MRLWSDSFFESDLPNQILWRLLSGPCIRDCTNYPFFVVVVFYWTVSVLKMIRDDSKSTNCYWQSHLRAGKGLMIADACVTTPANVIKCVRWVLKKNHQGIVFSGRLSCRVTHTELWMLYAYFRIELQQWEKYTKSDWSTQIDRYWHWRWPIHINWWLMLPV